MVTSHSQSWVTLPGLNSQHPNMATSAVPQSRPQVQDLVDASQLIKALIFMSHISRNAALCKLHHPRKLCCSHASLWGIILLPPFSRAGGNCTASSQQFTTVSLGSQHRSKGSSAAEQGSPCLPPGLHGCARFPFLLPQAASKSEPAPGKSLSQFASPPFEVCLLFPGTKAPTSSWEMGRVLTQPHTTEKPFAVVSRLDIKPAAESQREVGSTRRAQGPYFLQENPTLSTQTAAHFSHSPSPLCSGSFFEQSLAYSYPSLNFFSPPSHSYSRFTPFPLLGCNPSCTPN